MSYLFSSKSVDQYMLSADFKELEASIEFAGDRLRGLPEKERVACTAIIQEYNDEPDNDEPWSTEDEKRFLKFMSDVLPFFTSTVGGWNNDERRLFTHGLVNHLYRRELANQ